jgi:predicted O-methyltransferase YrrM
VSKDAFLKVPGHLHVAEGYLLQRLMEGKIVAECGTHHGRSAVAMLATAKWVTTIDNYQGDSMIGAPDWNVTHKSISDSGIAGWKTDVLKGDWTELLPPLLASTNAIFYDAAHEPQHPYEKEFLQMIEDSGFRGLVALHDYKPQEPAYKHTVDAIDQYAKRSGRAMLGPEPGTSIVWFEPF